MFISIYDTNRLESTDLIGAIHLSDLSLLLGGWADFTKCSCAARL